MKSWLSRRTAPEGARCYGVCCCAATSRCRPPLSVIPAKAGIHFDFPRKSEMDPGLRRDDGKGAFAGMTVREPSPDDGRGAFTGTTVGRFRRDDSGGRLRHPVAKENARHAAG